jgi:phosphohistidine phosphatase
MQLILVRHAKAAAGEPDDLRPLTPEGREQARGLAEQLRAEKIRPDAIVTSPLLRAKQTAEVIAEQLGADVVPDDRLSPGATAEDVTAAVSGRGETVVAVGHQPDCSRIAAALTGAPEPDFAPAQSFAIELEP